MLVRFLLSSQAVVRLERGLTMATATACMKSCKPTLNVVRTGLRTPGPYRLQAARSLTAQKEARDLGPKRFGDFKDLGLGFLNRAKATRVSVPAARLL